jgi:hypothetical protein
MRHGFKLSCSLPSSSHLQWNLDISADIFKVNLDPHLTVCLAGTKHTVYRETKSRHAVKHDGSLFRLIDQL